MKKIKINILTAFIAVCCSVNTFAASPDFIITAFTNSGKITYNAAQHAYVIPVSVTFKNTGSVASVFSADYRQFGIRFYAYKTSAMTDSHYQFNDLRLQNITAPGTSCTDGGQNCFCIFGNIAEVFLAAGASKTVKASLVLKRVQFSIGNTTTIYLRAEVNSTTCGEFSGLPEINKTNNKTTLSVVAVKPKGTF